MMYGYGNMISSTNRLFSGGGGDYNPLTLAWANNASESDTTILDALNTFEQVLIDNSLTAKTPAFYPMVGGTTDKCKRNFMNSTNGSAYELGFVGGLTFASTGVTPNGSTGYATTNYTSPNGDMGLFFYSRTDTAESVKCSIGAYSVDNASQSVLFIEKTSSRFSANSETFGYVVENTVSSTGFFGVTRVSGDVTANWRGNASTEARTLANTQIPLNLFNRNKGASSDLYSTKECAGAGMLVDYTPAELEILRVAIDNFNTSLSRNV